MGTPKINNRAKTIMMKVNICGAFPNNVQMQFWLKERCQIASDSDVLANMVKVY
jgi:hypothetical protein